MAWPKRFYGAAFSRKRNAPMGLTENVHVAGEGGIGCGYGNDEMPTKEENNCLNCGKITVETGRKPYGWCNQCQDKRGKNEIA